MKKTLHDAMEYPHLMIELDLPDREKSILSIEANSAASKSMHSSLIYTVMHKIPSMREIDDLTWKCIFEHEAEIQSLIWDVAKRYSGASYWMFAFVFGNDDREVVAEKYAFAFDSDYRNWEYHASSDGTIERVGSWVICSIPESADIYVPATTGSPHYSGFHFIAAPKVSKMDQYFRELLNHPEKHPNEICAFCSNTDAIYQESLFEVKPYGDESQFQVEISITPPLEMEELRNLLKQNYRMPYHKIELSPQEFKSWQEDDEWDSIQSDLVDLYNNPDAKNRNKP